MAFDLVMLNKEHEPLFSAGTAAAIAQVDTEFLICCEHYGLLKPRIFAGNIRRYSLSDVRKLEMVCKMQKDLGLDLDALSVVMHLREQLQDTQRLLDEKECEWRRKEEALRAEILRLRQRLAKRVNEYVL